MTTKSIFSNVAFCYLVVVAFLLTGCATTHKMNQLRVGMTRNDVINVMGNPSSTAAQSNSEVLRYRLYESDDDAFNDVGQTYFVRLVGGTVESFGKFGDFDSTKDPTLNLNINR